MQKQIIQCELLPDMGLDADYSMAIVYWLPKYLETGNNRPLCIGDQIILEEEGNSKVWKINRMFMSLASTKDLTFPSRMGTVLSWSGERVN